jgi:hypothetical protein
VFFNFDTQSFFDESRCNQVLTRFSWDNWISDPEPSRWTDFSTLSHGLLRGVNSRNDINGRLDVLTTAHTLDNYSRFRFRGSCLYYDIDDHKDNHDERHERTFTICNVQACRL